MSEMSNCEKQASAASTKISDNFDDIFKNFVKEETKFIEQNRKIMAQQHHHYCCVPNCHSVGLTSPNSTNISFFM